MALGRRRTTVKYEDLQCEPDDVMMMLIRKKNDSQSWRMIAEDLTTDYIKISPSLTRQVALGYCKSKKIEMALGIREPMVTVPLSCVKKRPARNRKQQRVRLNIDTTPELKARFDAQRGDMSRSEYLERLLNLEVKA